MQLSVYQDRSAVRTVPKNVDSREGGKSSPDDLTILSPTPHPKNVSAPLVIVSHRVNHSEG